MLKSTSLRFHRYRRPILIAAAVLGGVLWLASQLRPTGPAEGTSLQGEVRQPPAAKTLRIGTFNIHGCRGADDCRDLDRVAQSMEKLDFVALNEVHGPRPWERLDQAGELGTRLGMAWLFAPNTRMWYCLESGNGLVSALPVSFWQRIPLVHRSDRGYRNAVLVGLEQGGRTIRVLLTHVTRHDDRSRHEQLHAVGDLFLSLAQPAILLGDLNSSAADPEIRRLLDAPGVRDPVGEILGTDDPEAPRRIDWILARGMRCVAAGLRDEGASDHPLVWAELE